MYSSSRYFISELDCCSDDVIVPLKEYNKTNNQTIFPNNELLCDEDFVDAVDVLYSMDNQNVSDGHDKQNCFMLDHCEWDMQVTKNSYNTYIPQVTSQKMM